MSHRFKYIYGPVESWRMGTSLGIDPLSDRYKICNMDCVYCQLGKTVFFENERKEFVLTQDILDEINMLPSDLSIDYFTFSGRGEPTLAKNLGEMIRALKKNAWGKVAVITNSTLLGLDDVRQDLSLADLVLAKLDAYDPGSFRCIDKPWKNISFESTVEAIKIFRKDFKGKLALQIMFVEQNKRFARQIAQICREINPDEVQVNTPLRPSCAEPLGRAVIDEIKLCFSEMPIVGIYDREHKPTVPMNSQDTVKRHGNFKKEKMRC